MQLHTVFLLVLLPGINWYGTFFGGKQFTGVLALQDNVLHLGIKSAARLVIRHIALGT